MIQILCDQTRQMSLVGYDDSQSEGEEEKNEKPEKKIQLPPAKTVATSTEKPKVKLPSLPEFFSDGIKLLYDYSHSFISPS